MQDLWHFHFYGETPLKLVEGRERIYLEHFWNDFAADRTKSVSEQDRQIYTMPMLVLSGEKAGGQFLIDQGRMVDGNVEGVIVPGAGHRLIDEAPD